MAPAAALFWGDARGSRGEDAGAYPIRAGGYLLARFARSSPGEDAGAYPQWGSFGAEGGEGVGAGGAEGGSVGGSEGEQEQQDGGGEVAARVGGSDAEE